jgi:hypothetical protein
VKTGKSLHGRENEFPMFEFKEMQQNPSGYYFDSTTFLTVGNKLLNENRIAEALALFKMSIEYNPDDTTYNRIGYSISFYQDQTMTIRHPIF